VLATLFALNTQNVMQVLAKYRMKKVLSMMKTVRQKMIFAPSQRFIEKEYRWALRSFTYPSSFSLSADPGTVHTSYCPQLDRECLSLSVSSLGYILKDSLGLQLPSKCFIFDAEIKKWMLVKTPLGCFEESPASQVEVSKDTKELVLTTIIERPIALVLHRLPALDVDHTYAAIVKLDQLDAMDRIYHILSTIHENGR